MMTDDSGVTPGPIVFLGSGETGKVGGQVFEALAQRLEKPLRVDVLETPAGFELNSAQVAGRVAEFVGARLQNYPNEVAVIAARGKNSDFSPDNPALLQPMLSGNLFFMGPGSPTYAVKHLSGSLAWHILLARHRLGAGLVLASAAAIAAGAWALPVYEIYKVGEDPCWRPGLDLLAPFGLSLVVVSHWDNTDGGAELDTSRCFVGKARFEKLQAQLPADVIAVGLDEHTALWMDLEKQSCQVLGKGFVHVIRGGYERQYQNGDHFLMRELGGMQMPPGAASGIPAEVWQMVLEKRVVEPEKKPEMKKETPREVRLLAEQRQKARVRLQWSEADALRDQIAALGWQVIDTPAGPELIPALKR
ncbi:MAG: cysteinyl-tRNA synthetase [Chloroflexi bacterium]|nr:cysteinyl-tRNA synthetase [Chloroflexota bacterium]